MLAYSKDDGDSVKRGILRLTGGSPDREGSPHGEETQGHCGILLYMRRVRRKNTFEAKHIFYCFESFFLMYIHVFYNKDSLSRSSSKKREYTRRIL